MAGGGTYDEECAPLGVVVKGERGWLSEGGGLGGRISGAAVRAVCVDVERVEEEGRAGFAAA
jgi:hypothetical protein